MDRQIKYFYNNFINNKTIQICSNADNYVYTPSQLLTELKGQSDGKYNIL
jgi:hypothetical protein